MDAFETEHAFYYTSSPTRLIKLLDRWFVFQKIIELPGPIYELGVFKGVGLIQWATFIKSTKKVTALVGFDTFGKFPAPSPEIDDIDYVSQFIKNAGSQSIDINLLKKIMRRKILDYNLKLIQGDGCQTIPPYSTNAEKPKLINLDFDLYEPSITALRSFWPKLVKGGILLIDDYDESSGVRKAVSQYFEDRIPERTPYRKLAYFIK